MWSSNKPQKKAQEDESIPEGYKAPPPGYRYYSPRADSSPHYRRLLEPETTDSSSRSFKRRVLWIVLITILAIDLVVMFYGGYLSSWLLLTQPSGIFWAALGLIAAIGLLAGAYQKIFSPRLRRAISRNAPLVSALIALMGVLVTQEHQRQLDREDRKNSELQSYLSTAAELPANPDPAADTSAQAQTLTVCRT